MSDLSSLTAISPLDGRYRLQVAELAEFVSEHALIRYRIRVELAWLLHLAGEQSFEALREFSTEETAAITKLVDDFSIRDSERVREIEQLTKHDVKAVEYFIRDQLAVQGIDRAREYVHFGCTSEDINNLAYALMLCDVRERVLLPHMDKLKSSIAQLGRAHSGTPMLSRTHGQAASPTTLGKELAVFCQRLDKWRIELAALTIVGKLNGAVGNFNAHKVAVPSVDWPEVAKSFVSQLGLENNELTTQIESHDGIARFLNAQRGFNQVLLDFCRDMWSYISLGYFKQRIAAGEVGSSTMPHKVNPINFENAEGNLGSANALAAHLSDKLMVSRWQRDLSDSTAQRNLGVVFAHSVLAMQNTLRGLERVAVDTERMTTDLLDAWEVLAEPLQVVLRTIDYPDSYDAIKRLTHGRKLTQETYLDLLKDLELPEREHRLLARLTPTNYIGEAENFARRFFDE